MSAVDFGAWARPDLTLTLGDRTFTVREPSVGDMRQVLALAVRAEVGRDAVPPAIREVLDGLPKDGHPALGATYDEMVAAGVGPGTLARFGVYATLFWAWGQEAADVVAETIWGAERDRAADEAGGARPKVSRSKSGRRGTSPRSASETPSTTTQTESRSTPDTTPSRGKRKTSPRT